MYKKFNIYDLDIATFLSHLTFFNFQLCFSYIQFFYLIVFAGKFTQFLILNKFDKLLQDKYFRFPHKIHPPLHICFVISVKRELFYFYCIKLTINSAI